LDLLLSAVVGTAAAMAFAVRTVRRLRRQQDSPPPDPPVDGGCATLRLSGRTGTVPGDEQLRR
jgi:hypothetical protein